MNVINAVVNNFENGNSGNIKYFNNIKIILITRILSPS